MFYSYNGHYNRHYNSKDTISPLHFTPELIEKIAGLVKMSTRGLLARLLGCLLGVKCHRDINRQNKYAIHAYTHSPVTGSGSTAQSGTQ